MTPRTFDSAGFPLAETLTGNPAETAADRLDFIEIQAEMVGAACGKDLAIRYRLAGSLWEWQQGPPSSKGVYRGDLLKALVYELPRASMVPEVRTLLEEVRAAVYERGVPVVRAAIAACREGT